MYRFLAAAIVAGGFVATAAATDDIPEPIRDFLDGGAICSVATIEEVAREADRVTLTISIGPGTAAGLAALDTDGRADWLALHCPPPPTLARLSPDVVDLLVDTRIEGGAAMPDGTLSCRAHEARSFARRSTARDAALERLAERLERAVANDEVDGTPGGRR